MWAGVGRHARATEQEAIAGTIQHSDIGGRLQAGPAPQAGQAVVSLSLELGVPPTLCLLSLLIFEPCFLSLVSAKLHSPLSSGCQK